MNVRRMVAASLVAVLALTGADMAQAHAALIRSEPARRATLSKPPPQLRLWFNERLEPEYATVSVIGEGTGTIVTPQARVDKDDSKLLVLELPVLSAGAYTVKYRVLSVDGHTVDYGYTFTVKAEGAGK